MCKVHNLTREILTSDILGFESSPRKGNVRPHLDVHVTSIAAVSDWRRQRVPAMFQQLRGVCIRPIVDLSIATQAL